MGRRELIYKKISWVNQKGVRKYKHFREKVSFFFIFFFSFIAIIVTDSAFVSYNGIVTTIGMPYYS